MKPTAFIIILMGNSIFLMGQSNTIPISISYLGNYAYQPGVKIGSSMHLKSWKTPQATKSLIIDPQVAYYMNPGQSRNLLFNTNWGYKIQRLKNDKMCYQAFTIGIGYLFRSNELSQSIDLGNGEILATDRKTSGYIYPSINYEFGRQWNASMSWFTRYTLGQLLADQNQSEMNVSLEIGLTFQL